MRVWPGIRVIVGWTCVISLKTPQCLTNFLTLGIRTLTVVPNLGGGGIDRVLDGLQIYSIRRATGTSNEDREDPLGLFHPRRRAKFHILFSTTNEGGLRDLLMTFRTGRSTRNLCSSCFDLDGLNRRKNFQANDASPWRLYLILQTGREFTRT